MIPFSPPDISGLEIAEVIATLQSGWITTGPRTKQLEKDIAEWLGTEKCVCLNGYQQLWLEVSWCHMVC